MDKVSLSYSALLQVHPLPVDTVAGHILPGGLSARTQAERVLNLSSAVDQKKKKYVIVSVKLLLTHPVLP